MIKKFQIRFIVATMLIIGIISLVTIVAILTINKQNYDSQIDDALVKSAGRNENYVPNLGMGQFDNQIIGIPICVVEVYPNSIIRIKPNSTASINEEILKIVVDEALKSNTDKGYIAYYKLKFCKSPNLDVFNIAFADTTYFDIEMYRQIVICCIAWLLLMLILLFIVWQISKRIVKPIEKSLKQQQQFIADASHELKTPLTVILANTSILKENSNNTIAQEEKWIKSISDQAHKMQNLTQEMLTLAQNDAGVDFESQMQIIDFSKICNMITLQYDAVAFENNLLIESNIASNIQIKGIESRISTMVSTLLENACKYAYPNTTIFVYLEKIKGHTQLSIANTGDTIAQQDLEHIFDRFYKIDKSRSQLNMNLDSDNTIKSKGVNSFSFGLGLSIVKECVKIHKGTINVTSLDNLTTFTIKIPII
ncbi:MAG: HAMP domain-containing histidine kinase [Coriobacteriales bacterium]|nr:HAMP domain-containing histidine kinase [Coriobacteriales bacterium]